MDPVTKTLFILFVVFGSIFGSHWLRYHRRKLEMRLDAEKEFSKGLKVELDEIHERLANLEKIVTDKGYRVREEIDRL